MNEKMELEAALLTGVEGVKTTLTAQDLARDYLEYNRYYQNRAELRQFARKKQMELGTCVAMFRHEKGWSGLWISEEIGGDLESEAFLQAFRDALKAEELEAFWN